MEKLTPLSAGKLENEREQVKPTLGSHCFKVYHQYGCYKVLFDE